MQLRPPLPQSNLHHHVRTRRTCSRFHDVSTSIANVERQVWKMGIRFSKKPIIFAAVRLSIHSIVNSDARTCLVYFIIPFIVIFVSPSASVNDEHMLNDVFIRNACDGFIVFTLKIPS